MKKFTVILFYLLNLQTVTNAQIHLEFGSHGVEYDDTASHGEFLSFAFWIVNKGPDTLVDPIDINLFLTDSSNVNSTSAYLGNFLLTNNFLSPNDSLFIVSWDYLSPQSYILGDNIVVIWPSFVGFTPFSYDVFTGNLFVSNTSSFKEKVVQESILIYPNPIIHKAIIQSQTQSTIENLRILDFSGKVIRDIKISNEQYVVFEKKEIPKGIYFIELTTNEKKYLQKIIIH